MADGTTVLIVDDHALFRQILVQALARHPGFQVAGEAATIEEALSQARILRPDIVLMDLRLRDEDGVEATRRLRAELPGSEVVVVTSSDEQDDLIAALYAGAKGYVLKTDDFGQLIRSLEAVVAGQALLSPEMTPKLLRHLGGLPASPVQPRKQATAELTEGEVRLLGLVAVGSSNRRIGEQLCLSESTVRTYLTAILGKLGLENRVQLAMYALQHAVA